jgi:hypothetical protein
MEFPDGLVLLHVRNTSGKSTALKSIIYALGLEKMFGPANHPPLTPAMTSAIKEGDDEFPVVESYVWLEIENHLSQRITIRRKVIGEAAPNWKIVEIWEGSAVGITNQPPTKSLYVRDEGSATREQGFYPFLAAFIGWTLPEVVRFDGPACPLYMECLLPLFYIEQSHGWTGIQATTPRYFGIRQVEKKAIEFILALDSAKRDNEKLRLEKEETEIRNLWIKNRSELDGSIRSIGGTPRNLPSEPVETWPLNPPSYIEVFAGTLSLPLNEALLRDRELLNRLETDVIPNAEEASQLAQEALSQTLGELEQTESYSAELYEDLQLERANLNALATRIAAVDENLQHNLGTKKIREMGATVTLALSEGKCPTCHQDITDSLLEQTDAQHVMTLDENIEYLRAQLQTLANMEARGQNAVQALDRKLVAVVAFANELRGKIRALRRTLVSASGTPSEAAVRERLTVEHRLERRRSVGESFLHAETVFGELARRWQALLDKRSSLRAEQVSAQDERKRQALEARFVDILRIAGFRSFAPDKFNIDRETFRPMREGFDIVYDVSASDNIRSISSYVTALLELGHYFQTNHPGLLILDEPRQQNLDWSNFSAILERLALSKKANQQVIVATSDSSERIEEFAARVECTRIALEGPILRKV